jgi:hypothetical protein
VRAHGFITCTVPLTVHSLILPFIVETNSSMSILALFLACSVWVAIVQSQFFVPDGTKEDFSESWTVGEVMTILWSKGWYGIGEELSSADLWITWFDSDAYSQLLLRTWISFQQLKEARRGMRNQERG